MTNLYPINQRIAALCEQLETAVDPETGEVLDNFDEVYTELKGLNLDRQAMLEDMAKETLNTRAEAAALKAEEARLKERRQSLEAKEARMMRILNLECGGEKTDLGVATVRYRKTQSVDVTNVDAAVEFLASKGLHDCYHFPVPEPVVDKVPVKKLLKTGVEVPGLTLVESTSCTLR